MIVAIVATPLLPVVSAALLALETIRRGPLQGLVSAAFGVAGLSLLAALSRTGVVTFALIGVASMGAGVAVGALIRWAGNLVFAFQAVWLVCFVLVAVLGLVGPDPAVVFAPVLKEFEAMVQAPPGSEADVAELTARLAAMLPAVTLFSSLVGALLLSYWWWSVASGQKQFGAEFRRLKLGRWLGSVATLVVLLALVFGAPVVQNLLPMALFGFMFQGLAVMHAWAHAKQWHPALLGLVYVLLVVPPLTVAVMVPLGVIGMVDTWLDLRKPVRSAA
ncbi:MAG TPA: hypothetical protein VHH11_17660 [Gammaproteobacteria bacterium]|nr:hypothetical protein [Gammaproteobacteria bacterium]